MVRMNKSDTLAQRIRKSAATGLCVLWLAPGVVSAAEVGVRGNVNPGGPENWPASTGMSTGQAGMPGNGVPQDGGPTITFGGHMMPLTEDQLNQQQPVPGAAPAPVPVAPSPTAAPLPQTAPTPQPVPPASVAPQPAPITPPAPPRPLETHVQESSGGQVGGATSSGQVGLPLEGQAKGQTSKPERPVIYVDEQGNQVPKPPEPEKMFTEAEQYMEQGKYPEALAVLHSIRAIPGLSADMIQKTLYAISDCNWNRYQDNPLAGFEPIVASTNEAMNANLRSPRVPDALLRLGLANANVGNLDDASGYIVALQRRFPHYPGVAQGFTTLGEGQLKAGQYAKAEHSFGVVLDKYPESAQLQPATVGLAKALIKQGKDKRAQVILDFLGKRWPRHYIKDPDFLLTQADNDEKMNRKDSAMDLRWLYVNLDPTRPENAPLLLKMGDDYMNAGKPAAANFVYQDIRDNFPSAPEAITARRRLAEGGIYDAPVTYAQMSKVFAHEAPEPLFKVYTDIAETSDTTPEGIMAQLKLAMWLYWDKQYPESMGKAGDFIDNYPENQENTEAREVLWLAFQKELAQSLAERNYGRILLLWNGFPIVRERYGKIDAPLRFALAEGWAERGEDQKAFDLLSAFLKDPMDPQYGEAAFSKFFNHYLKQGAWEKILDLGKTVRNWKMRPELQNQLDYAQALSAQNLNLVQPALHRWRSLANRTDIPLYQQAYATYFVAKDAEKRRDIRNAYEGNRKVVELFQRLADERSDKADPERIKEAIASLMDICEVGNRVPEAMQWVEKYSSFVTPESPEYPGLRYREARLYRKLGDNSRAQALLEDVINNHPTSPFAQAAQAEMRTFDVSRDLQRYVTGTPKKNQSTASGSTAGNWSSTAPAATE